MGENKLLVLCIFWCLHLEKIKINGNYCSNLLKIYNSVKFFYTLCIFHFLILTINILTDKEIDNYYNISWVILLIFPLKVTKNILWFISHGIFLWFFNRLLKKIRSCQLYLYFSGYFCTQKCSQLYDTIWKRFNNTLLILHSYKIILKLHGNLDLHKLLGCDLSLRFLILGLT